MNPNNFDINKISSGIQNFSLDKINPLSQTTMTPVSTTPLSSAPFIGPLQPNMTYKPQATMTSSLATNRIPEHEKTVQTITQNQQTQNQNKQIASSTFNPQVSIVDYLSSTGQPSDFATRSKLAANAGITNYTGTADQNTRLLQILSSAPKPEQPSTVDKATKDLTKDQNGTQEQISIDPLTQNPDGTPKTEAQIAKDKITSNLEKINQDVDNYYNDFLSRINNASVLTPEEDEQVKLIKEQFERLRQEQILANRAYEGGVNQAGAVSGRSMYHTEVQFGLQKAAVDQGLAKLEEISSKELAAIAEYKEAVRNKNYKQAETLWNAASKYTSEKSQALKDIYDIGANYRKEVQDEKIRLEEKQYKEFTKPKEDILIAAFENGLNDPNVIEAIKNATSVEEAIINAGDYLTTATGIVGEYIFYARQEEMAGREPMSFNSYQTMDVNRKASIARAGTKAETENNAYAMINTLISTPYDPSMMEYPILDEGGYFTVRGFKDMTTAALADGITRKQFLESYGSFLHPSAIEAAKNEAEGKTKTGGMFQKKIPVQNTYGLTPLDLKTLNVL